MEPYCPEGKKKNIMYKVYLVNVILRDYVLPWYVEALQSNYIHCDFVITVLGSHRQRNFAKSIDF